MLRRLLDIVQLLLLNPLLVRSPATMALILEMFLLGILLIGTF